MPPSNLPLTRGLRVEYLFSLLIAVLTTIASSAGLLQPDSIYPTAELRQSFIPNDVMNLLIGLPILLGSMWLAQRGRLIGLLFWPGAILYGLYNYLVYVLGTPFGLMYPLYLLIVTSSIYTTISLVVNIDGEVVKQRLNGRVPAKFAGGVISGLGFLILMRTLVEMTGSLANQTPIAKPELALLVTDFVMAPAWVIGGILLWRRHALGYVGSIGLLFQTSMLFVGLIFVLLLSPPLTGAPFMLADVLIVFAMGFICFIPFALVLRGVVNT